MPNYVTGITPLECLSKQQSDHTDLKRTHVWGAHSYVLDPRLQDGKKIPKWNRRSRRGKFLGFSSEHSSLISIVRNLRTGYISPQFHLIHDDRFHTVPNFDHVIPPDTQEALADIFDTGHEHYLEEDYDGDGKLILLRRHFIDPGWKKTKSVIGGRMLALDYRLHKVVRRRKRITKSTMAIVHRIMIRQTWQSRMLNLIQRRRMMTISRQGEVVRLLLFLSFAEALVESARPGKMGALIHECKELTERRERESVYSMLLLQRRLVVNDGAIDRSRTTSAVRFGSPSSTCVH